MGVTQRSPEGEGEHAQHAPVTTTPVLSLGGGIGAYHATDGDVPLTILRRRTNTTTPLASPGSGRAVTIPAGQDPGHQAATRQGRQGTSHIATNPQHTSQHPPHQHHPDFTLIHKNARSLSTDDDVEELLDELGCTEWDIVTINETWRLNPHELWTTKRDHHLFAGSGFESNTRGVAFLIHRRWTKRLQSFTPIDERIAYIDIDVGRTKLRITTAYFPHTGYNDTHIQRMYHILTTLRTDATRQKRHFILTGDFNAQVGSQEMDNNSGGTIGKYGLTPCNSRGQWMRCWACSNSLVIANTHFSKRPEHIATYHGPNQQPRQLDYILVDKTIWKKVLDAGATHCPDLGSDHKAVKARFRLHNHSHKTPRRTTTPKNNTNMRWPPNNLDDYKRDLRDELDQLPTPLGIDERCRQVEDAIINTSRRQQSTTRNTHHQRNQLNDLIAQRQCLHNNEVAARRELSKLIRKEVKVLKRIHRRSHIENILLKFQGLKQISGIKSRREKTLITSMTTQSGGQETDRQSIADIFATFYETLFAQQPPTTNAPAHNHSTHYHGNVCDENDHQHDARDSHHTCNDNPDNQIPPFSMEEMEAAITKLRNGRCRDTSGLIAEMIKAGGAPLTQHLLQLYNDIIQPRTMTPTTWRRTTIKVIHKSGDTRLPQNYRPISIIPLLYKLFSRLIYNRLETQLDEQQSPDQAGFRHNFSTEDHLYTMTLLQERSYEWQLPLWIATVDFKKAFDTVDHHRLWAALARQRVPAPYVDLIREIYTDHKAVVRTDRPSREFDIERGVKQGDPLSTLLFNAALEDVFRELKDSWAQKHYGIQLGHTPNTNLTNLRFADDVLLTAPTLTQLSRMLADLAHEAAKFGLQLHPDKTHILTNISRRRGRDAKTHIDINGQQISILSFHEHTKYLGRKTTFDNYHATELDNRISAAWRKFHLLRHELTSKTYPLKSRLRLFDGTVTPTILYGSAAWTLTKDMEMTLKRTQRRMLRLVLGTPRRRHQQPTAPTAARAHHPQHTQQTPQPQSQPTPQCRQHSQAHAPTQPNNNTDHERQNHHDDNVQSNSPTTHNHNDNDDGSDVDSNPATTTPSDQLDTTTEEDVLETWVDFIQRATRIAEETIAKHEIEEWTTLLWRRTWRWCHRVAQQPRDRWSHLVAHWRPDLDDKRRGTRHQARPRKRWDDDIQHFLRTHLATLDADWRDLARNPGAWRNMEQHYLDHMLLTRRTPNKTRNATTHKQTATTTVTTTTTTIDHPPPKEERHGA